MTIHTSTNIHGMGAYEGGQLPGELIAGKSRNAARFAMQALTDRDFAEIVAEEIRNRPALLLERIIDRVTK